MIRREFHRAVLSSYSVKVIKVLKQIIDIKTRSLFSKKTQTGFTGCYRMNRIKLNIKYRFICSFLINPLPKIQ